MNFEHFISAAPTPIRRTLVSDIQEIINQHRGWLNQVSQAAVNKMPSLSPHIEEKDAETLCVMGLWVKKLTAARLDDHPAVKGAIEHHNAMHSSARRVNESASKNLPTIGGYESFLIDQYKFFSDMNALLEAAVRDQALFHYASRMIRSQHAEDLFLQTVIHLQSLPDEEQKGCVAVINVDPQRNIERDYQSKGVNTALHEIAKRFKHTVRQSDAVIEDSENTIIIIFPGMDIQHAKGILERITQRVMESPFNIEGESVKPEVAIGVINIDMNDTQGACLKAAKELCIQAAKEKAFIKPATLRGH